ncbi:hypothetical protein [Marinitenerispora sediminis]|uniref:hypothetical protein n=1 Tax=Marinitenerispora sediminis TaxID=1931232 RepID=UPI001F1D5B43|nr:hypothetical protein [Marinitenerispora sediminis]
MLRLRFREILPDRSEEDAARLALRSRGDQPKTVHVPGLRREGDQIRADLATIPLPDGTWDVMWVSRDGRSEPVATRDPGFSLAERAAYLAEPRDRELRVIRGPEGRLRLRSAPARPYAEVEWVDVTDSHVAISGVLAYVPRTPGRQEARLVARQRELSGVLTVDAEVADGAFSVRVPLADMAAAHESARAHNEWDLWLTTPADGRELRLASLADDIVGKKKRISFPSTVLAGAAGRVRIRPYYTVHDHLSLLATEAGAKAGAGR